MTVRKAPRSPFDDAASPKVTPHERRALEALAGVYHSEGNYLNWHGVCSRCNLNPRQAKRAVRRLARKGLAEYGNGLWCPYEGTPAGSGYRCTESGYRAFEVLTQ